MTIMNPNHPGDPDYLVRYKLHDQRPAPGGGPYVRTIIGDASVCATFDSGRVGLAINDHEAIGDAAGSALRGVLMSLTADEALILAGELELAAQIADPKLATRMRDNDLHDSEADLY